MRKFFKVLTNVLLSVIVAVEVVCLLAVSIQKISGENPSLFGYTISIIATESMASHEEGATTLEVGDAILSKIYVQGSGVKVGDILSYTGGEKPLITHELIQIIGSGSNTRYILKGNNNDSADSPIRESQIASVYICKLPIISFIYSITSNIFGFVLLVIVPIALIFIDELVGLIKSVKKEVSENEEENNKQVTKDSNS